ncbi:hypothetical protein HC341_16840 [Aquisalimonas sp. 2447]|uniref:anti-sigma factor family protein n=1 Tax=Aquisalimonas sp. 2447 TaxID=2740807 RepID=UPI0014325E73|nr:zf-HC2 domain-containing protein [Aquisalimonas sp. 2447]QIT56713.1 hypothetical protein HC341_16840 [Aquisalimonas sp. 2447]
MDCQTLQSDLDAILDGNRGQALLAEVREHLGQCPACRAHVADVRALQRALADGDRSGMPAATRQRLLRSRHVTAFTGAAGVAAGVVLAVVVTLLWPGTDHPGEEVARVDDSDWRTTTVQMEFRTERALSGVRFSLELPEGTELEGHPGQRRLSWEDDLEAGANRLRIPLILTNEPGGELVARLEHDGRSRELRLAADELPR